MTSHLAPPSRHELFIQHEHLDILFDHVLAAFTAGDRQRLSEIWGEFETSVTTHMDAEEQRVFPSLRLVDPERCELLLAEHRAFRRRLCELGIASDLHLARLEAARELVENLRRHLRIENQLMYRAATNP